MAPGNLSSAGHFLAHKDLPIYLPWYPELGWTLRSKQRLRALSLSSKKLKSKWEERPDTHKIMRDEYKDIYYFTSNATEGEARSRSGWTGRERMCARKNPDGVLQGAAGAWGRTSRVKLVWGAESCLRGSRRKRRARRLEGGPHGEVTGAKGRSGRGVVLAKPWDRVTSELDWSAVPNAARNLRRRKDMVGGSRRGW